MSLRLQLLVGTLILLAGAATMGYAVYALSNTPYVCAMALMWLCFVEYAVVRAWWLDASEVYDNWRARP